MLSLIHIYGLRISRSVNKHFIRNSAMWCIGLTPVSYTHLKTTTLSGCVFNKCSPKRHWDSCQSSANTRCFFNMLCIQFTADVCPPLIRCPSSGLYCITFPVRTLPVPVSYTHLCCFKASNQKFIRIDEVILLLSLIHISSTHRRPTTVSRPT